MAHKLKRCFCRDRPSIAGRPASGAGRGAADFVSSRRCKARPVLKRMHGPPDFGVGHRWPALTYSSGHKGRAVQVQQPAKDGARVTRPLTVRREPSHVVARAKGPGAGRETNAARGLCRPAAPDRTPTPRWIRIKGNLHGRSHTALVGPRRARTAETSSGPRRSTARACCAACEPIPLHRDQASLVRLEAYPTAK
ncbi:hypothetical protein BS78_03G362700 [Paspalum vaginatum]|nr:hypothetical protein BS78_03G362700 [Paspalum vaginatum]